MWWTPETDHCRLRFVDVRLASAPVSLPHSSSNIHLKFCSCRATLGKLMLSSPSVARRLVWQSTRWSHRSASSKLNPVSEHDLAYFSKILPSTSVLSVLPPNSISPSELSPYNDDWMGKYHGHATTVLRPHTTRQVSEIVKWCWERRIGVVPQGGNTGLVGGSVPLHDEVIVSLGNMSKVRSFDPISG